MKITVFIGSARKKNTYDAVTRFLRNIQSLGEIDYEIVFLSDYKLEICKGCCMCFEKGEKFCPLKDNRDVLIDKMMNSDGVVFAAPNYSFQVSAQMKLFLDRLGFFVHRPHFFGKAYTNIVVQGVSGGRKIVKCLDFLGNRLGFNTIKGCCLTILEPMRSKEQKKNEQIIVKQGKKFYRKLTKPNYPVPSLFKLMEFRIFRTIIKLTRDKSSRDYNYFMDNGWFSSEYFYPTKLGQFKKWAGNFFDSLSALFINRTNE